MAETLEDFVKQISTYRGAPSIGCNYWETRHLDVKDVAKLVRKDLAEWRKREALAKPWKFSVRIERYAGGQSLCVKAKQGPGAVFSKAAVNLDVQHIIDSYNYDASHGMRDYSCTRFYTDIQFL